MKDKKWTKWKRGVFRSVLQMTLKCLCSGERLRADKMIRSPESLTPKDCSASVYSSRNGEGEQQHDNGNIEEAESSLREGVCLNYDEARALLGRLEYQRGNVEAALRVFDGIDISSIVIKMKITISKTADHQKLRSHWDVRPMTLHAVSLLMEAMYLKARALYDLGKFKEAAQECNILLDIVESSLPEGLPSNLGSDCKLHETIGKAVELLPELWKLSDLPHEAISSYRRALLSHWSLDAETTARIQKEFAVFLLYGGCEASPPSLRSQMDGSFVPRNNLEEAILLLMFLLRKFTLKRVECDPSVIHHLSFALSVSGQLKSLAGQFEELLPGVFERRERLSTLALCYLAEEDDSTALNLLRKLLKHSKDDHERLKELLLASNICGDKSSSAEEGASYARRALASLHSGCNQMECVANCLLGISLSAQARSSSSDSEKLRRQNEALEMLGKAGNQMHGKDCRALYNLSLENADQRKLDAALYYAKQLLKLEAGSNIRSWVLLARILSAQKQFIDAESVVNAALEEMGKWSHGELLRIKAKVQIAQGKLKRAVETYTQLLAIIQLRSKSFAAGMKFLKGGEDNRSLEMETWYDLVYVYLSMSRWRDAEVCLSKMRAICPYSALSWHATGQLYESKGLLKEALGAYEKAVDIDPTHVPSLVSTAAVLQQLGGRPLPVVRCFLTDALRLDRTNHVAWFKLGLLYEAEDGGTSALEAAECFQAAALLEDTAPVEPFR